VTTIEVFDDRLAHVVRDVVSLERLCTGAIWSEGPVWISEDDSVLWSDIPNNRMLRWCARDGMTVFRDNVEFTNGHTRDRDGSLLHCSHGLRAVFRTDIRARANVSSSSGGRASASMPERHRREVGRHDLVHRPAVRAHHSREGHGGESEIGDCCVFRFDPRSGALDPVTDLPIEPNGLAFSPDESLLYVSDTSAALGREATGNHCIFVFDVQDGRRLANGRRFAR
jgi:gluconolactonase